jgi:hypothetical protein
MDLADPACALEVNEANLQPFEKNMLRFAVTPDVPGAVNRSERGANSIQQGQAASPGRFSRLPAVAGEQRPATNHFQNQVTALASRKFPEDSGHGDSGSFQLSKNSAFVLDLRKSVYAPPIRFTMAASFLDDHKTRGQDGQVESFIHGTLASLHDGFYWKQVRAEGMWQAAIVRSNATWPKRVVTPARHRVRTITNISANASSRINNGSASVLLIQKKGTIPVINDAVLPVSNIKWDLRSLQFPSRSMQLSRKGDSFHVRTGVGGQEFSDLGKAYETGIQGRQDFQSIRNFEKDVVSAQNRPRQREDPASRTQGCGEMNFPALDWLVTSQCSRIAPRAVANGDGLDDLPPVALKPFLVGLEQTTNSFARPN